MEWLAALVIVVAVSHPRVRAEAVVAARATWRWVWSWWGVVGLPVVFFVGAASASWPNQDPWLFAMIGALALFVAKGASALWRIQRVRDAALKVVAYCLMLGLTAGVIFGARWGIASGLALLDLRTRTVLTLVAAAAGLVSLVWFFAIEPLIKLWRRITTRPSPP